LGEIWTKNSYPKLAPVTDRQNNRQTAEKARFCLRQFWLHIAPKMAVSQEGELVQPKLAGVDFESTAGVALTNFKSLGVDFTLCGWPYIRQYNIILL